MANHSDGLMEEMAPEPVPAEIAAAGARPGAAFSKRGVTGSDIRPPRSVSHELVVVSPAEQGLEQSAPTVAEKHSPDFRRALDRSADRRGAAEQSINHIMLVLDRTPAKKRVMRAVRKDVAAVFVEE